MSRKLCNVLALSVALVVGLSIGRAQKNLVTPLVPAASWRLVNSQALDLNRVRQWSGDPVIEREYGVKSVEVRACRLDDTVAEVIEEQASDVTAAYGLLTFYQTEMMTPEKGMELTLSGPDGALMARGRFFIRVPRPRAPGSQLTDDNFRALLIFVGGTRPSSDALASLPAALPEAGLVPGSEKYVLGPEAARRVLPTFRTDLIGFSQGAEVHAGAYLSGKGRATVLAVTYPTPQIARVRFGAMERFLGINQDHGLGSIYGRRRGSFVFLVLNGDSPALATRLMDQFKVSQSVTLNERYPGDESVWVQMAKLVLANLALVGILVGLAILGGVLIFLFRRLAAMWFPHSSWANPSEGTIIRLHLS